MALIPSTLSAAILAVMDTALAQSQAPEPDNAAIRQQVADGLANAVDAYIKTAQINIATGIIQVQGSATAQSNLSPLVIPTGSIG
jgi:hypothetical protein